MMKKINGKSLAAAILMSMAFSMTCAANTAEVVSVPETAVAVQVEVKQPVVQDAKAKGIVNWEKGANADIAAVGVGLPPENAGQRGTALARRAAIVDAYRILAETVQGVQIDAETTMQDLVITNDLVKAKVNALVKGAHVIDEGANADGSYFVKMSIPMFGKGNSVAAVALPEIAKNTVPEPLPKVIETTLPKEDVKEIKSVKYTGVVVDADNMNLEATFSPVIYDTNGRIVYGLKNLDRDMAISKGMVDYAGTVQEAANGSSRAGSNPLVVKALDVRGGANSVNMVNVVVSVEDADKILLANENSQMLEATSVVFVK